MYLKLSIYFVAFGRFVAFGWLLLLPAVAPSSSYAQDTGSTVKGIPATTEELDMDFPLSNEKFRTQIDAQIVTQGTYTINNPYRYLQRVHIRPWLHYNGIKNVHLSAALAFIRKFDVAETGLKKSVEIRLTGMATITQPRSWGSLYEQIRIELKNIDSSPDNWQHVPRFRFRFGQNFVLGEGRTKPRIAVYQEIILKYQEGSSGFDIGRVFAGYGFNPHSRVAATIGFIAQFQYRSSIRQYDAYYGPAVTVRYTFGKGRPSNLPIVPDADID